MENANMPVATAKEMVYQMANGDEMRLTMNAVRQYLVQGHANLVTDSEILYYMHECKARKLNPFLRQCWLIKYSASDNAQIVEAIHHKRAKARRAEDCVGWEKGLILQDKDGEIKRSKGLVLEGETLIGAYFTATPKEWETPYDLEINLDGYIKKKQGGAVTAFWAKEKQPSQLMKVVESQGLSALWGDTIGNTYIPEELPSIDMFAGENGQYQKEEKLDTSAFDKMFKGAISKERPEGMILTFLEETAKGNNTSVDNIKVHAAGDFKSFMGSFDKWFDKKAETKDEPEKEETKTQTDGSFWEVPSRWKTLSNKLFLKAITDHAEALDIAGKEIRNAVWAKFIKHNEINDWPLKPAESVVVEEEPDRPQLCGSPGYTARNSEDFDKPGKAELDAAKLELMALKGSNLPEVQEAAESLKMSVSPITLDGFTSLIEATQAIIDNQRM